MKIFVKVSRENKVACRAALDSVCNDFNSRTNDKLKGEGISSPNLIVMSCCDAEPQKGSECFMVEVASKSKLAAFVLRTQKKNFMKLIDSKLKQLNIPAKLEFK